MSDDPGFASERAEVAAWRVHRSELMATEPGQRPYGFWKFDLRLDPPPSKWWDQVAALESRGLLFTEEALRLEVSHPHLRADQHPHPLGPEHFRCYVPTSLPENGTGDGDLMLHQMRDEFEFTGRWHEKRGRAELAAKFRMQASHVADLIEEFRSSPAGLQWSLRRSELRRRIERERARRGNGGIR